MGRCKRRFLKCNIPMLLNVIVAVYLYLTANFLRGNLILAAALSGLTLWSLYMGSLSHPGPVRPWMSDACDQCKHCGEPKPQRVHHCRRCNECIDRYDHHCDWLDNCVGRRNYKSFVLFLVYINGCIGHYFWQLGCFFNNITCLNCHHEHHLDRATILMATLTFLYTFVVVPCWILSLIFLFRSLLNAARNMTTYEENVPSHVSYDRGFVRNMKEVLGDNVLMWAVPTTVESSWSHNDAPQRYVV